MFIFSIDVKFDITPNLFKSHLLTNFFVNDIFSYIIYEEDGVYYKVNGFLISDILRIYQSVDFILGTTRLDVPKKFRKYLENENTDMVRKYLSVSILKRLNDTRYLIDYRPYVKYTTFD